MEVEDNADEPRPTAFHASYIRYEPNEETKQEDKRASGRVVHFPQLLKRLGVKELCLPSMWKACLIEAFGMGVFTYAHVAIVSAGLTYSYPPLLIGIFHGFLLALFILQFAASSGAHFNSLITFATVTTGHTPFFRGLFYIPSQILGAFIGALCMKASINKEVGITLRLASCNLGDLDVGQGLMIEVFFSFLILFASYGIAFNARQRGIYGPVFVPLFIGLVLCLVIFSSASLAPPPFTGAGANPSLCFGCTAALSLYEEIGRTLAFENHWVYWVGPGIAAIIHAILYLVAPPHHHVLYEEEKAAKAKKIEMKSV
jgi:glycerol uptake facilitator-like aquaporin